MRNRSLILVLATALALPFADAAAAQSGPPVVPGQPDKLIEPPKNLPKAQRGDRGANLDKLFAALKAAPSAEAAKFIENRIWAVWLQSESDTANLLMARVKTAIEAKDIDLAIRLLGAIVEIRPDFVEAWNRRATLYYNKKEFGRALEDIREVLAREPRHFGALSGLGIILQELGEEDLALNAFRRALAVHPKIERVPDQIKRLIEKVEGRDI